MDELERSAHQRNEAGDSVDAASSRGGIGALVRAAFGVGAPPHNRLAIDALPEEAAELAPGHFYAIYAKPRTNACDALIWATAKAAATRDVTIVLSRSRRQIAARMRELGFGFGAALQGWPRGLSVLSMPEDDERDDGLAGAAPAGNPRSAGVVAFARLFGGLRALKRFGFRANSLYLIEGAERWLTWGNPDALAREGRLLANWCAARRIALVLLLDPSKTGAVETKEPHDSNVDRFMAGQSLQQARYLEFHGACAGVARMGRTHGELLWHVEFWRAGRALATGETRALRFTEDGRLSVVPEVVDTQGQAALRLARDETRVVATRAVVAGESWVPPEWEVVDDQEAAVTACAGALAATVLLDYRDRATLEPLCAAVHSLRRDRGRALKIVVVERREALRHQYELLLLSLGANLIIGRELPFSRVQSLLRSLQGQLDTRPIAADYQAALAAALTDDVRGYLNVPAFCDRVEAVLARGAVLDLPHVLAKLTLLPELAHAQALRHCTPRRAGDVVTADAAHLYVFLFACRMPDADVALERIFDVPVDHLSDRVVYLAEASIECEVKELAEANRRAPIADYGDLFPAAPLQEPHRKTLDAGAPSTSPPALIRETEPARAAIDGMLNKIDDEREAPSAAGKDAAAMQRAAADSAPAAVAAKLPASPRPAICVAAHRRHVQPWPIPVRGEARKT